MSEVEAQLDGCMATEAVLITVDVMELMVQIVQSSDTMQGVLDLVLRVILFALSLNESATALRHLFASQRSIVAKVQFISDNNLVILRISDDISKVDCYLRM